MRSERRPNWLVDLKWLSALALVVCIAVATLAAAAARATAPTRGEAVAREVLTLVLGPASDEIEIAAGAHGYQAGQPLEVLPGANVFVAATEIPTFEARDAVSRLAGVLSERYLTEGGPATWARVEDAALREQLGALDGTTLRPIANAALQRSLLGVGLDNGTRAANWPAQAAQNPGQEVQPLVGIFVTVPPDELGGRSPRQIGERVIDGLALVLAEEGAGAARALVTNTTVGAAFDAAIDGPVRRDLHAALSTGMAARQGEIAARLSDARAVLAGAQRTDDPWEGVLSEGELAGLSDQARRERILAALAQRARAAGHQGVLELVRDEGARQRVVAGASLLDAVRHRSYVRYRTWAYVAGVVSLLVAGALVLSTSGNGRALWPGICLLAAAGPGLALAAAWRDLNVSLAWPAGPLVDGAVGSLRSTLRLIAGSLAPAMAENVLWVYLLVAGTGAALVLIGLAASLAGQLRPRRRSLL